MVDLKPDEWVLLSLGAFDELRQKISQKSGREEVLIFLDECVSHLTDEEEFKKRYNYNTGKFVEFPSEYLRGFTLDNRLESILKLIKKYHAKDILDVGSRAGFLLFTALKRNVINSAVGIDIDSGFIDLTKRATKIFGFTGLEFYNTLFEYFEIDRKFDAVIMTDLLEHVIDPKVIIQRSRKFIKETGVIIISVPVGRPPIKDKEKDTIISWGQQEHVHLLKLDIIKDLCTKAGYAFVEHESLVSFWDTDISVFKPV